MYTSGTNFEWKKAEPGHIPDQAVIYGKGSEGDVMYVAYVIDEDWSHSGVFQTNDSCAEYLKDDYDSETSCSPTFKYLVLTQEGKSHVIELYQYIINSLRPRQNDRHFAGDTFKRIFLTGNVKIPIKNHWSFFLGSN